MLYITVIKRMVLALILTIFGCAQHVFSLQDSPSFPYPIDIVYLWVDGSDPDWAAIKNHYSQIHQNQTVFVGDACIDSRFYDHEELRFSLRSLVKFAPFFNHIYIVTMNQRPKWLLDHPQITIIDHQDIFPNLNDLPTFNSQAIECHLHRIPGLAEHFIYFNDDVLLGKPVSPYDFFTEDGKIRVLFEKGLTVSPNPEVQATLYRKAWVNSNRLLNTHFMTEPRHRLCHAPFALRKSFIEKTERFIPFVFASNSSHKFRTDQDFNLTNGLLQYIWMYQGKAERGSLSNKLLSVYSDRLFPKTQEDLDSFLKSPLHTFCVSDCIIDNTHEVTKYLRKFFETLLPDPAPWEQNFLENQTTCECQHGL